MKLVSIRMAWQSKPLMLIVIHLVCVYHSHHPYLKLSFKLTPTSASTFFYETYRKVISMFYISNVRARQIAADQRWIALRYEHVGNRQQWTTIPLHATGRSKGPTEGVSKNCVFCPFCLHPWLFVFPVAKRADQEALFESLLIFLILHILFFLRIAEHYSPLITQASTVTKEVWCLLTAIAAESEERLRFSSLSAGDSGEVGPT